MDIAANFLNPFLNPLEIVLLVTTLYITSLSHSVEQVIRVYRNQSYLLAIVTGLTTYFALIADPNSKPTSYLLIPLVAFLPLALAYMIKPVLVRATVQLPGIRFRFRLFPTAKENDEAERNWRKGEQRVDHQVRDLFVFIVLITLAILIAAKVKEVMALIPSQNPYGIGLMVALSLHLAGLYNMVIKRDIISQVVGLLIMDHGLFLAAVKIAPIPVPAMFFVVSLYFYTLITLTILIFLLPQVRQHTGSVDLDEIERQTRLKG